MQKLRLTSIIILAITLTIMCVDIFITPLSDWTVRITGLFMLVGIGISTYCLVKERREKRRG